MQRLQGTIINAQVPSFAVTEVPDVLGRFAFVHKEALLTSLDALVSEEADDDAALTHEARQQREAEVTGDLLDIERQEAALVWQAQSQGLSCEHRKGLFTARDLGMPVGHGSNGQPGAGIVTRIFMGLATMTDRAPVDLLPAPYRRWRQASRPASSKPGVSKMDQLRLHRLRVQDRDELSTLLSVVHGAMKALRRDGCGDWTIAGSRGHIRACDGTLHVYVQCRSALH